MTKQESQVNTYIYHGLFLLLWMAIGAGLRFTNLGLKNPSSIELATLIFSLGHSVLEVPFNQVISLDTLLQPLQVNPANTVSDVITYLMKESTHPPLYFVLTHWWLNLFPDDGGLANLWAGRSLSAIFGIISLPSIFALSYLAFRSFLVSHITTALMAVSPYGIYLAQEARHYTLAILFIMASFACLLIAVKSIIQQQPLSFSLVFTWIVINALGIASHYFFTLSLGMTGLVMFALWLWQMKTSPHQLWSKFWQRIYIVALGTAMGGLVWLPFVSGIPEDDLTTWIQRGDFIAPVGRLLLWMITMLTMLPIEGQSLSVIIPSVIILLLFLAWIIPALIRGVRNQRNQLSMRVLLGLFVSAIVIFFVLIYIVNTDITLAARYNFVYFPVFMLIIGAALGYCWQELPSPIFWKASGKRLVIVVILMGLFGSLIVVFNQGYQKSQRGDLLANQIISLSEYPTLIAMKHKTHSETRALMIVARELWQKKNNLSSPPQFLLAHQEANIPNSAELILEENLQKIGQPLDLWAINLNVNTQSTQCREDNHHRVKVNGYRYHRYHCFIAE